MPAASLIGPAIATAGSIGGALISANASSDAASAMAGAAGAGRTYQERIYKKQRADLAPWREAGGEAVNTLTNMLRSAYGTEKTEVPITEEEYTKGLSNYGLKLYKRGIKQGKTYEQMIPYSARTRTEYVQKPGESGLSFGKYEKSPYYDFVMGEGTKALERGAAARGGQLSGAEGRALTRYGQNLASTDYDKWLDRFYDSLKPYQSLAGLGQISAGQTVQAAGNLASGGSQNILQAGEANAAGILGQGNTYANLLQSGGNALASLYGGGMGMNFLSPGNNPGTGYQVPNSYMDF